MFLQAYSDPTGDGLVRSVYFPNRWLPVRADLFNRAAWQLHNRANVMVYAWMPVLAYDLDASIPRVTRWQPGQAEARPDPDQYRRCLLYTSIPNHVFLQIDSRDYPANGTPA